MLHKALKVAQSPINCSIWSHWTRLIRPKFILQVVRDRFFEQFFRNRFVSCACGRRQQWQCRLPRLAPEPTGGRRHGRDQSMRCQLLREEASPCRGQNTVLMEIFKAKLEYTHHRGMTAVVTLLYDYEKYSIY